MQLLHWSNLQPKGPDNLAVIRFNQPIVVQSLRIYPKHATPFQKCPGVFAETEPDAFFVDVYLNAVPDPQSGEKWSPNILGLTRIAYTGGMLDFPIAWSTPCMTRLVILKGSFATLGIAIYGATLAKSGVLEEYKPTPLPEIEKRPLHPSLDPSANSDPTMLAQSLLALIPDGGPFPRPTVPMVLRLMFCLKAPDEDWETPGFPFVFTDLEGLIRPQRRQAVKREEDEEDPVLLSDDDDDDQVDVQVGVELLQQVALATTRPASDDTPYDKFSQLAARIMTAIENDRQNHPQEVAIQFAQILANSASQHADMARTLIEHISLPVFFSTIELLTDGVLSCLRDAAANPDIAHALSTPGFINLLRNILGLPSLTDRRGTTDNARDMHVEDGRIDNDDTVKRESRSTSPLSPISPISTSHTATSSSTYPTTTHNEDLEINVPTIPPVTASEQQRKVASELLQLLYMQSLVNDVLCNTRAHFNMCAETMWRSLGSREAVVGAWIESMIGGPATLGEQEHSSAAERLKGSPVVPGIHSESWAKALRLFKSDVRSRLEEMLLQWDGSGEAREVDEEYTEGRIGHAEFIAFVRAYIGVGSVVGVFAWADSCPESACRERALGIIHLWQNVEGYREIVKHFLLLPQIVTRLEYNVSRHEVPRSAGTLAEKILVSTVSEPSILSSYSAVPRNVLKLGDGDDDGSREGSAQGQLFTYIPSNTLLEMRKMAWVAHDGIPGALDELRYFAEERREWETNATSGLPPRQEEGSGEEKKDEPTDSSSRRPLSLRRLRTLRVAISVVMQELAVVQKGRINRPSDGLEEQQIFEGLWQEDGFGLFSILVDLVDTIAEDLADQLQIAVANTFSSVSPPLSSPAVLEQLLSGSRDALTLILTLMRLGFPPSLTIRTIRAIADPVIDTYVSCDLALTNYQTSAGNGGLEGSWWAISDKAGDGATAGASIYDVASRLVSICTEVLHMLCDAVTASGQEGSVIVMKSLLRAGEMYARGWRRRDPATSLAQVCRLVDEVIPSPDPGAQSDEIDMKEENGTRAESPARQEQKGHRWSQTVLTQTLPDFQAFIRLLDVDNRMQLTRRLVAVDNDVIGIGPWLVMEDLRFTTSLLQTCKLRDDPAKSQGKAHEALCLQRADQIVQYLHSLATTTSPSWLQQWLSESSEVTQTLKQFLDLLIEGHAFSPPCLLFSEWLQGHIKNIGGLNTKGLHLCMRLRDIQSKPSVSLDSRPLLSILQEWNSTLHLDILRRELGHTLMAYAFPEATLEHISLETSESILSILEWMIEQNEPKLLALTGVTNTQYIRLCDRMYQLLPYSRADTLHDVRSRFYVEEPSNGVLSEPKQLLSSPVLSINDIQEALQPMRLETPQTPTRRTPDVLGSIVSPPAALLRSPAATGLTKTYSNNDFRQLRVTPTARQNTSRLPSMHVDVGILRTVD
ncbi:hypothetical protein PC9H_004650 [Pleurotus ostreatus]|uniref:Virilizer N-terminal domain-containing protein n=1 Tax=Pleurotus ostreatus TaxID=5322 RepID=A0A8H6ZZA6_PLEOS|nr:uncharacterized protein PC9H_004650 [Pleurotus ostreatus]KAF7432708.1 hypothetical protein PC9H_004650 [Pleurotus ostreatus]